MSDILGRDKVKDELVSIILGKGTEKEKCPHVISLVGMGSMGKTTLAQLAFNHHEVKDHFEDRIWVCVSEPFDQCRVAKAIVEALGVHQALLKPFRDALKNCGSQSSRILVTTRKDKVAKMMESANTIKLEELSEEDCWLVFRKIAFSDKDPKQCEQLEVFGRQISKKCKGLPLAAKTLGSLMHFKKSIEEWKNVLDSNLWELEDVERGLFAPLLLSYFDLPSPLKRCFSYCAIFPKDHDFNVNELVHMWTAHGFVESMGNMEVEIMAREYFDNLVIRSFFQKYIYRYRMHDIVHDFAQSITKNECFIISSDIESKSNYNNARHLRLVIPEKTQFPVSIDNAKNLHTLIFFNQGGYNISNLFQNFRLLRVLTLECRMELPHIVENLVHLRYLNLFECNEGIGKLINLRHLVGKNFLIPRGIGRLISLRALRCFSISEEDSEGCKLGELKNLNHLQGNIEIRGLGNMVDVSEVENAQLKKKIHLREMLLSFKKGKDRGWQDYWVPNAVDPNDRRMERDVLVLNALEPPQELEQLDVNCYQGITMSPNWLMFLIKLKTVSICWATKLMSLPPLGKFPFLESLNIWHVCSLKKVGVEYFGIESKNKKEDIIFPNLKYLSFVSLEEWEEWIGIGGKEDADCITVMPHLQCLEIRGCRKLKSLPDFLRTIPLNKLEVAGCPIIKERCQRETGEDWHTISHIPIIDLKEHDIWEDYCRLRSPAPFTK
ncbi:putative disease resistance protein RGA3 [Castanea sativa]|uniref:putative disease resistance protein RGA3 n=1 Tax=Castanea sativa TaxID=21020 RepID=UPI003F64E14D